MEIPLQAQVECTDGVCGRSVCVLMNPVVEAVTHVVVKDAATNVEYMVPIEMVTETIANMIRLRCTKAELEKMEPFIKTEYVQRPAPLYPAYGDQMFGMGPFYYMPYVTPEITVKVPVGHRQIPPGELAVRRGTRVEATDGYIGKVDEFVVDPQTGHITHLVMREGHLLGQRDVIIPLSALGHSRADTVFLNLDKHQVESLPAFPIHRLWD